jgi:hypothetical protein
MTRLAVGTKEERPLKGMEARREVTARRTGTMGIRVQENQAEKGIHRKSRTGHGRQAGGQL